MRVPVLLLLGFVDIVLVWLFVFVCLFLFCFVLFWGCCFFFGGGGVGAGGILLPLWTSLFTKNVNIPTSTTVVTLIPCPLSVSVSGFSLDKGSQCQVDQCWERYTSAKDALELSAGGVGDVNPLGSSAGLGGAGDSSLDNEAHCVALRTYWSCIKNSSRGCTGDIRYYSVRNGVRNQMKQYNCTMNGPTVDPSRQPSPQPRPVPYQCQYKGKKVFSHCGLFGDPHLRTFTNQFQTCKVKGAWPLVNNQYLIVQVTNDPVVGGAGDATATSKVRSGWMDVCLWCMCVCVCVCVCVGGLLGWCVCVCVCVCVCLCLCNACQPPYARKSELCNEHLRENQHPANNCVPAGVCMQTGPVLCLCHIVKHLMCVTN